MDEPLSREEVEALRDKALASTALDTERFPMALATITGILGNMPKGAAVPSTNLKVAEALATQLFDQVGAYASMSVEELGLALQVFVGAVLTATASAESQALISDVMSTIGRIFGDASQLRVATETIARMVSQQDRKPN